MEINLCLQQVLTDVMSKTIREVTPVEAVANAVMTQAVERTLVNEQLVTLVSDLEERVKKLEKPSE
jgi:hypothetical protein